VGEQYFQLELKRKYTLLPSWIRHCRLQWGFICRNRVILGMGHCFGHLRRRRSQYPIDQRLRSSSNLAHQSQAAPEALESPKLLMSRVCRSRAAHSRQNTPNQHGQKPRRACDVRWSALPGSASRQAITFKQQQLSHCKGLDQH
jgi:hypothetical protein